MQVIKAFAGTNGLDGRQPQIDASFEGVPTTLQELVVRCTAASPDSTEHMSDDLSNDRVLLHTLMVYKKCILWDIILCDTKGSFL